MHLGWDIAALTAVKDLVQKLFLLLFSNEITRLLIDPNRSLKHPKLCSVFRRKLDHPEREVVLDRYDHPHWGPIGKVITETIRQKGCVLHLGLQSFLPVLNGVKRRADLALLCDPQRRSGQRVCLHWQDILARLVFGLRIRWSPSYRRYADGLTTALRRKHGARRCLGIEIEMNQALLLKGTK